MTYGRERFEGHRLIAQSAAVSRLAELVRGELLSEGPLIRPVSPKASLRLDGPPSPQGEKGRCGALRSPTTTAEHDPTHVKRFT